MLAEAATAPRNIDMRAHATGRGGGGGARNKQEGEDGDNVRSGRRARAKARRNIRRRDSQGASQITRTTVRALSRLVERILMWGPSVGVIGAMGLWGYRAIGLYGYRAIGLLDYWAMGLWG